jgi:hypothetical protein
MKSLQSKFFLITGFVIGWFAIIGQFYIFIERAATSLLESVIQLLSFFTILTNLLVALCFSFLWLKPQSGLGKFFTKPQTRSALTIYIVVVGAIYNIILRFLWNPQGLQKVVDEMLHSIIPILFLVYWFVAVPKNNLQWKNIWAWLIYPLAYFAYTLVRGELVGWYPYPFMDVNKLGYSDVLINSFFITSFFVVLSFILVAIAKWMSKNS